MIEVKFENGSIRGFDNLKDVNRRQLIGCLMSAKEMATFLTLAEVKGLATLLKIPFKTSASKATICASVHKFLHVE